MLIFLITLLSFTVSAWTHRYYWYRTAAGLKKTWRKKEVWTAGFRYRWRNMEETAQDKSWMVTSDLWTMIYALLRVTGHKSSQIKLKTTKIKYRHCFCMGHASWMLSTYCTLNNRQPCILCDRSSGVEHLDTVRAVLWVTHGFSTSPEDWTVLTLLPRLTIWVFVQ